MTPQMNSAASGRIRAAQRGKETAMTNLQQSGAPVNTGTTRARYLTPSEFSDCEERVTRIAQREAKEPNAQRPTAASHLSIDDLANRAVRNSFLAVANSDAGFSEDTYAELFFVYVIKYGETRHGLLNRRQAV